MSGRRRSQVDLSQRSCEQRPKGEALDRRVRSARPREFYSALRMFLILAHPELVEGLCSVLRQAQDERGVVNGYFYRAE